MPAPDAGMRGKHVASDMGAGAARRKPKAQGPADRRSAPFSLLRGNSGHSDRRDDYADFMHFADGSSDLVAIFGADGFLDYLNAAGRTMIGVGETEPVSGLRLADLSPPEAARKLAGEGLPIALHDLVWRGSSVLLTRSGREIAVEQTLVAKRTIDGSAASVATLMRDVRKSDRRHESRRLSDRWFRLLVDIMTDGYAFIDSRGIVVDSNPQFVRMLGLPRRAVIGHPVREFVAIETHKIEGKRGAHGIPAGYHGEATLRRADGQSIPVIALVRNTTAAEAGVAGSCLIVTDIAEGARGLLSEGESEKDRRCYSCQILNAQESERKRIATELHDGLGQSLSIIKFKLEQAIAKLDSNTSVDATAMLEELVPRVKGTLDEVRRIAMNLRPSTLEDLGILATLSWFIREYGSVYHSIAVDKSIDVRESDVPDALKLPLFRIVQEALNNVAKHSRATRAFVGVEKRNGVLRLLIEDNGVGFDLGEVAARRGPATTCGHAGMHDRVALSGGSLTIESTPRIGVRISVTWPDLDVQYPEDHVAAAGERL